MPRFDIQKVALYAAEEGILNLDVSLGAIVKSRMFETIQAYEDPWIIWCGNDLRLIIWPGPRGPFGLLDRSDLGQQVRESLG